LREVVCAEAILVKKRENKTGIKSFIVLLAPLEYTTGDYFQS
jgi:hypothetical protein